MQHRKEKCEASVESVGWCSFLYGAAARAAKALGYERIITYTLDTEPGTSLRASGWTCAGPAGGKRWTGKRKPITFPPMLRIWGLRRRKLHPGKLLILMAGPS